MKASWRGALLAAVLSAHASSCGSRTDVTPSHVASATCPLRTPGDWQTFLEAASKGEDWATTCSDLSDCKYRVGEFRDHVKADIVDVLAKCTDDVADNPPIASCTDRLRRFVPAWSRQHDDDSYGFARGNHEYVTAQEEADKPAGMMEPPPALLAALPKRADIEAAARANGWVYLTHDSCLGGVRTFVVISDPDDRFDQWMLFSFGRTPILTSHDITSFLAVQKRDAGGALLPGVRVHFRDYQVANDGISWKLSLDESFSGKCYSCHTTGVRQLVPTHGQIVESAPVLGEDGYGADPGDLPADFGFTRLASLNHRLLAYGAADWNGTIVPADHGPALGESQGCTSCHNGAIRGVLSVSTSEGALRQKLVDQVSMWAVGPGRAIPDQEAIDLLDRESTRSPPLSDDEATVLALARQQHQSDYDAFMANRYPALRSWLLAQRCD